MRHLLRGARRAIPAVLTDAPFGHVELEVSLSGTLILLLLAGKASVDA